MTSKVLSATVVYYLGKPKNVSLEESSDTANLFTKLLHFTALNTYQQTIPPSPPFPP